MLTRLLGLAIIRGGGSLTTLTQCALYGVRFVRRSPTLAAALGGVLEAQYCCPVCMSNTRGPRVDLRHHTVRVLHTSSACRAGHNKWSKIKRHKAVTDQEKSRLRGKLLNQIRAAVASGGNDPATNVKLGGILTQARSSGVPKGNMEAALKLNSGGGSVREAVIYEGRGPSGYLVIIEALTDNRKRTRPEIRHIIEKQGGLLREPGSSAFMFEQKAIVQLSLESAQKPTTTTSDGGLDPMELAIEVGAEDVDVQTDPETADEVVQLKCEPNHLNAVCTAVRERGYEIESAAVDYLPKSCISLTQGQFDKAEKLVELLSEQSDVVSVYSNHDLE